MKKDIHPQDYRPVVFQDTSNGATFLTRSTAKTSETITLDGKKYPLVKVHISSASHPFYTGEEKIVDVEGRVDRYKARQAAADKKREALINKAKKSAAKATETKEPKAEKIGIGSKNKKPVPKKPAPKKPVPKKQESK